MHGNIPHYAAIPPHPDQLLHTKLLERDDLLHLDIAHLTEHFEASQFSYSTQALPINVLLDTLVRPNGDTCDLEKATNVTWTHQPEKAIPHIVIGNTASPGGQWVDNPVQASWDIGTLSYAGMLSLPGYSFAEHHRRTTGKELPPFTRPSRRQITEYFRSYPHRVLIDDAIQNGENVAGITRTEDGFHIRSHNMRCKHLVLASGVFSELISAPALLQPLLHLPSLSIQPSSPDVPLLIIGSGFSAADIIISSPPNQKILHIYKWAPSTSPSPLRACHEQAYPEYAGVYRRMKQAARMSTDTARRGSRPKMQRASTSAFNLSRDWDSKYEGLPNTSITDVRIEGETALITLQTASGQTLQRRISRLEYVVGRRGSLQYLSKELRHEVCGALESGEMLSGQTLRDKVLEDIEVAPNVFAIGSLTGDSLVRFAFGSCTYTAGKIMSPDGGDSGGLSSSSSSGGSPILTSTSTSTCSSHSSRDRSHDNTASVAAPKIMNGLDGHHGTGSAQDLRRLLDDPLDRRKLD